MMVARLVFQPDRIPRSTTRVQWRAIDRRRRGLENEFRRQEDWVRNYVAKFGGDALSLDLLDGLVNPVLVMYPE
jgi:hypothetical protein